MNIRQTQTIQSDTYQHALMIRQAVFISEQHVPVALEIDQNEASCIHFVLYLDDHTPVATLRILPDNAHQHGLIQRVATLKTHRGQGYAFELISAALAFLKTQHYQIAELHAQVQAIPFYEKLGFKSFGDEFFDAGITHIAMKKLV